MTESFLKETKEALSTVPLKARHCRIAELHAIAASIGQIGVDEDGALELILQSENLPVMRRADYLLRVLSGQAAEASVFFSAGSRTGLYSLFFSGAELTKLLRELGFLSGRGALRELGLPAPERLLNKECCRRAFLRGAFLAGGYVSDPESAYHFEIVTGSDARAEELVSLLGSFDIRAKATKRGRRDLLYVKETEAIADILSLMSAFQSRLAWENARILRSWQGQINRQVNCETANLAKSALAGQEQIDAIRKIEAHGGLSQLPAGLQEIARLRLEHPEASLTELGELLEPKVGRSGVNHRLRKIRQIAEEL